MIKSMQYMTPALGPKPEPEASPKGEPDGPEKEETDNQIIGQAHSYSPQIQLENLVWL